MLVQTMRNRSFHCLPEGKLNMTEAPCLRLDSVRRLGADEKPSSFTYENKLGVLRCHPMLSERQHNDRIKPTSILQSLWIRFL